MTDRQITQRPWNERPEQADQTVAVLEALGFYIQLPLLDQKFDEHGTLVSETFTKRSGEVAQGFTEKVTVDYTYVRTYLCPDCTTYPVGLVADKYTHTEHHQSVGRY